MRKFLNLQYMYLKILLHYLELTMCSVNVSTFIVLNMIHFKIFRTCGMVRDRQWWLAVILSESGSVKLHTQWSHNQPPAGCHRDQPHDGAVA